MQKKELEKIEKLKEEMKLTNKVKKEIIKKVINNFFIAIDILLMFVILIIAAAFLNSEMTLIIYRTTSIVLIIFTIFLFERAYKNSDDDTGIHGLEFLALSIVVLLTPYIFLKRPNTFTIIVGAYFTAYYILKNLVIYKKEKNKFLREKSDIEQIIKKESKDELAQKQISKNKPKTVNKVAKKRGRPKKITQ